MDDSTRVEENLLNTRYHDLKNPVLLAEMKRERIAREKGRYGTEHQYQNTISTQREELTRLGKIVKYISSFFGGSN